MHGAKVKNYLLPLLCHLQLGLQSGLCPSNFLMKIVYESANLHWYVLHILISSARKIFSLPPTVFFFDFKPLNTLSKTLQRSTLLTSFDGNLREQVLKKTTWRYVSAGGGFEPFTYIPLLHLKPTHALLSNTLSHPHFKTLKLLKSVL
jgi:hypothetical protein